MATPKNAIPKKRDVTAQKIIKAAKASEGLPTSIAKKARLSYMTIWRYTQDYPEVKEAVREAKEKMLDMAESKLFKRIEEGDLTARE